MDEQFAAKLDAIDWFASLGKPLGAGCALPVVPAESQVDALLRCSDPAWEDVTLEARNRLTLFLHQRHREQYQQWNEVTTTAKARVITPLVERVWRPFAERRGLGKSFLDCVSWDVLAAIMEHEYRDCTGRPIFFSCLLDIYRTGHFPCGWQGDWPTGELVVW